ncbi:unnamed protein product [Adineta ricciae]|uniref:Phospholipase n=1 Tax=Adineta ricciae TaxID=249248 RepID=A0A813QI80_ADIRI|nr:unnamed protein product [Adineta ricciae]
MNTEVHPAESIHGIVRSMEDVVGLTLTANHITQRHVEYLPYPEQTTEERRMSDACSLEQIYSQCNQTFARDETVQVIKLEAERIYNAVTEFLYPYLYSITLRYGSTYEWTIKRRYRQFAELHNALRDSIKLEFKKSRLDLNSSRTSIDHKDYPCFPTQNDRIGFINERNINERCKMLQNYLSKVLENPFFREHIAMRKFLRVSPLTFVEGLGKSFGEGNLSKRSNDDHRGRSILIRIPLLCDPCKVFHEDKWFVIKDSYVVYMTLNSALIGFPMLVDQDFSLDRTFRKTRTKQGIRIKNSQRQMIVKCRGEDERNLWFDGLMEMKEKSIFTQNHLFDSFAPQRQQQYAQWFINGQSYMEALAKAILSAREEIFISDWWLSPEIMLVRPAHDDSMRLDHLLGKRAEEGIRVYVLIFKDIVKVVGLNSLHTKRKLLSRSPTKKNIKVIRHPDHRILPGTESSFLFSHHEKTVIIDQRLAFIGGIDLCWGRWDTDDYRLVDLSDENITELKLPEEIAQKPEEESHKEEAAIETADEMATNSNEHHLLSEIFGDTDDTEDRKKRRHEHKWQRFIKREKAESTDDDENSSDEEVDEVSDERPKPIVGVTPVADSKCQFFLGKDYSNYYQKDFEFVEKYDEDYIDRKLAPRMPWHDEVLAVSGEAARDCARHFIQRWNIHKADKFRFNDKYPYLLPKTDDDSRLADPSMLQAILPGDRPPVRIDAQCVRSASFWSCGIEKVERSIHTAYIHMIENAEHFIYIENQFFVTIAEDDTIKNEIGEALYQRIIRAHNNHEKFRIFILLPLLPGFANSNAVQAELYYIMRSINKDDQSLYQRLKRYGIEEPGQYVTFNGMRNWDILMGSLVTEIIYVHSKLMIVDDRMCICGSANINDRSFQGTRDSEVCLVVNDIEMVDSHLNGRSEKVGVFCSTWRKKLFRQVLGIKDDDKIDVDDPCSDELYNYFCQIAKKNTEIYEEVFNTVPTNKIRRFADIEEYNKQSKLKETDPHTAYDKCKQIQGFLVEFPIDFLADDNIKPKWNTQEGIAPMSLWT